jgi:hypothetical protein
MPTKANEIGLLAAELDVTSDSIDVSTKTGSLVIPRGTTAQRPSSATNGMLRFNTDIDDVEYYSQTRSQWIGVKLFEAAGGTVTTYSSGGINYKVHTFTSSGNFTVDTGSKTVNVLIAAGGGAGGWDVGGGGGAGGYINTNVNVSIGTYQVTVGGGGSRPTSGGGSALSGSNSSALGLTSIGGGGGGNYSGGSGASGGSGGGGSGYGSVTSGGSGTAGQGFAGGSATNVAGVNTTGAGGGGAGGIGSNAIDAGSDRIGFAPGGSGAVSNIRAGTNVTYCTGGNGGADFGPDSFDAAANTGNGGVGAGQSGSLGNSGGAGGSGIVIIRYEIS